MVQLHLHEHNSTGLRAESIPPESAGAESVGGKRARQATTIPECLRHAKSSVDKAAVAPHSQPHPPLPPLAATTLDGRPFDTDTDTDSSSPAAGPSRPCTIDREPSEAEIGRAGSSRPPVRQRSSKACVSPSDPFPLGLARIFPDPLAVGWAAEPANPPKVAAIRNTRVELDDDLTLASLTS